ncbi:MAG: SDR family oxidoreductase [Chloroflexota bacterium]|nr:SDR family oxidoreductase [Chloroflexota bacterium]
MSNRLEGKVALITGAGSGLGEATARVFTREGCSVGCLDIRQESAERVRDELRGTGSGEPTAYGCDVGDAEQVFAAVQDMVGHYGRIDLAVNCAAIDHTYWVHELTIEQWDQVLSVNLRGPFLVAKAVLPAMKAQQSGHIVNVASTAGVRVWTGASPYHASKWGLIGFGRALGLEGREDNVHVTTVIPGGMRTHFFDRFVEQGIPLPDEAGLQEPANVAEVILTAVTMPEGSVLQEVVVTPPTEPSWP